MKAMILAAGLGTRLGSLTKDKPKALVKVAGKPLLAHIIEKLVKSGFTEITVNVHHYAQQVIDYLSKTDFGITINISDESKHLLDTGGAILNAKLFLDGEEPFLIHNVDILSDIDLALLMKSHQNANVLATLAVSKRDSTRKLLFDPEMLLRGWKNQTTGDTIIPNRQEFNFGEFAFSGIHILSPRIFQSIKQQGRFSIIDTYLSLCSNEKIMGYDVSQTYVLDVGKPESISLAARFLSPD